MRMAENGMGTGRGKLRHLDELAVGARGRVFRVDGEPEVRRRLLEMGFCNGAEVEVIRRAPLGDPTEFHLRGYYLSLRQEQARHVLIVPASENV